MAIARTKILPPSSEGPVWVHAISRCVRKAYLCGGRDGRWDHRRGWVESRLRLLAGVFAVEVAAYAVMSNHLHVVLRLRPDVAAGWDAVGVMTRWRSVYAKRYGPGGEPLAPDPALVAMEAQDTALVERCRARLADLGWLMKALKEGIAKRANREDDCTGAFWEGRYTSVPLLDQAALVACMAYVDLNPIRAGMCDRPERATHTGVRQRIGARQRHRVAVRGQARVGAVAVGTASGAMPVHAEDGVWVCGIGRCSVGTVAGGDPWGRGPGVGGGGAGLSVDDYLTLVDATGRWLRAGKRGAIPSELAPILARLDLDAERWIAAMSGWRSFLGRAVGALGVRAERASALGLRWIRNRCPLFVAGARERAA